MKYRAICSADLAVHSCLLLINHQADFNEI